MIEQPPVPAGVVTFLLTDVEGSTGLWEADPEAMAADLARHDEILRLAVSGGDGYVFSTAGDAFAAAFSDPQAALEASLNAQRALAGETWLGRGAIRIRAGIHVGTADERDGDYFGPTVNRAARIMASGHGGQILTSAAFHDLMGPAPASDVGFVDLGEHRLKDIEGLERIFQVLAEGLDSEFPPLSSLDVQPNNLPSSLSSFVGRRTELRSLRRALSAHRLVTIVGPGGAGKTRLAVELGARSLGDFPDGVWLVELAAVIDPSLVAAEVLGQLRLRSPVAKAALDALVDALRGRSVLLIVDNCEHLIDEVAKVVRTLLEQAPGVRVLATSRGPVRLPGEEVWAVPPMSGEADREEDDAVRLFIDRSPSSLVVDAVAAEQISRICEALDGLPLAVELAAARLGVLSLNDLERRLDDRLGFLRSRDPTALPHHRTLLATIEWSYDLLDQPTRRIYEVLSVFPGSFDLETAEAMAFAADTDPSDVLDAVEDLVAQSMLTVEAGSGRHRMLESMRQHGERLLGERGAADEAHRALLAWAVEYAAQSGRGLQGPDQAQWVERTVRNVDNVRAALDWAVVNDPVTGLQLTARMSYFWWLHAADRTGTSSFRTNSYLEEGSRWSKQMIEAAGADAPPKLRAHAQRSLGGMLQARIGEIEDAAARLDEARLTYEELGDARGEAWTLVYMGMVRWGMDDPDEIVGYYERARKLFTEADDLYGVASAALMLTYADVGAGRGGAAVAEAETFDELAAASGVPQLTGHAADLRIHRAIMAGEEVDPDVVEEAVDTFIEIGLFACLAHTVEAAALWRQTAGDPAAAAELLGVSEKIRDELGHVVPPYERRAHWVLDAGLADWDPAQREKAIARGHERSVDDGIAFLRAVIDSAR